MHLMVECISSWKACHTKKQAVDRCERKIENVLLESETQSVQIAYQLRGTNLGFARFWILARAASSVTPCVLRASLHLQIAIELNI